MKIFTIIVNYNGLEDTLQCLKTLHLLEDRSYELRVVLVDNGSKEEEYQTLSGIIRIKYPHIKLIRSKENLGFAKGNNLGINYALNKGADYILLLNNDTTAEMNFVKSLLQLNAPICSPVVKFREFADKPKLLYDLGGFVNWWTGRTWHLNVYEDQLAFYRRKRFLPADFVAGCSMLIKREVMEKTGSLDEKYFIYFEDVDFCISAAKKGFGTVVDTQSVLYHKLGGSMDRWSNRAIFRNLTGNLIFILKHMGLRRITGLTYLSLLTLKILRDRVREHIILVMKKDYNTVNRRKWKGARRTVGK